MPDVTKLRISVSFRKVVSFIPFDMITFEKIFKNTLFNLYTDIKMIALAFEIEIIKL